MGRMNKDIVWIRFVQKKRGRRDVFYAQDNNVRHVKKDELCILMGVLNAATRMNVHSTTAREFIVSQEISVIATLTIPIPVMTMCVSLNRVRMGSLEGRMSVGLGGQDAKGVFAK